MAKFNRQDIKDWVKALRSGKFQQGSQALKRSNQTGFEYCCLGVLAEIKGCKWEPGEADGEPSYNLVTRSYYGNQDTFLPPTWLSPETQDALANMNDGNPYHQNGPIEKHTFAQIATWIEKHVLPRYKEV